MKILNTALNIVSEIDCLLYIYLTLSNLIGSPVLAAAYLTDFENATVHMVADRSDIQQFGSQTLLVEPN